MNNYKTSKKGFNLLSVFLCLATLNFAQTAPPDSMVIDNVVKIPADSNGFNFESFSPQNQDITKELEELTPAAYQNHPEFGVLPYNAPCNNCFELLQNRSDSARYFVEKGTNGTQFYSQKAYGPINTKNSAGQYIALYPKLKPKSNGVYVSGNQLVLPTELDINNHQSAYILPNGERFEFNRKVEMFYNDASSNVTNLGEANWSNYTVGDDGIKVIDAWPNIDMIIEYSADKIESSYIVKSPLPYTNGSISFRDNLTIPSSYQLVGDTTNAYTLSNGGDYSFKIESAFGFDNSGIKENGLQFPYNLDNSNRLSFNVPVSWMTDPQIVYPLTLDPTVTSSATYNNPVDISYPYNTSNWYNTSNCGYTLTVNKPTNCTLTAASFDITIISDGGGNTNCDAYDVFFELYTDLCGYGTVWQPVWQPGDNDGTHTYPNLDATELIICPSVPTPVCSGSITFYLLTIRNYKGKHENGNTGCGDALDCQKTPNNTWIITLKGTAPLPLSTQADQSIAVASCVGSTSVLNPLPSNGKPGYTYAWSTGATSSTITANNAGGPYSVTVTDACGVTSKTNYTIVCPLSVSLSSFTAEKIDRKVLLSWQTASELDNDYFMIQRAGSDGVFSDLMKKPSQGNSTTLQSYSTYDNAPLLGTSYYRLQIYDKQGNISTSEIQSVGFDGGSNLLIIPNPNNGTYQLGYHFPEKGTYAVELYSSRGQQLIYNEIDVEKGYQTIKLDEIPLQSGVYFVKLHTDNQVIVEKMVVQ